MAMIIAGTFTACGNASDEIANEQIESQDATLEEDADANESVDTADIDEDDEAEIAEAEITEPTEDELKILNYVGEAVLYQLVEESYWPEDMQIEDIDSNGNINSEEVARQLYGAFFFAGVGIDETTYDYYSKLDGLTLASTEEMPLAMFATPDAAKDMASIIFDKNDNYAGAGYDLDSAFEKDSDGSYIIGAIGDPGFGVIKDSESFDDSLIVFEYHFEGEEDEFGYGKVVWTPLDGENQYARFAIQSVEFSK